MAMQKRTVIIALSIAAMMMVAGVLAIMTSSKTIPSSGSINAFKVGVYLDSGCNNAIDSIAFDTISPGYNTNETIFIRNDATSGGKSMSLSMTITNWNASCSPLNQTYNVATFYFNSTGVTLAPLASCEAYITLTALDNNETKNGLTFTNLGINIIGTEI
jgi:hypothetical protein